MAIWSASCCCVVWELSSNSVNRADVPQTGLPCATCFTAVCTSWKCAMAAVSCATASCTCCRFACSTALLCLASVAGSARARMAAYTSAATIAWSIL